MPCEAPVMTATFWVLMTGGLLVVSACGIHTAGRGAGWGCEFRLDAGRVAGREDPQPVTESVPGERGPDVVEAFRVVVPAFDVGRDDGGRGQDRRGSGRLVTGEGQGAAHEQHGDADRRTALRYLLDDVQGGVAAADIDGWRVHTGQNESGVRGPVRPFLRRYSRDAQCDAVETGQAEVVPRRQGARGSAEPLSGVGGGQYERRPLQQVGIVAVLVVGQQ